MLLIKNARILTMEACNYDCGDILIDGGKIKKIGINIQCEEHTVIDCSNKTIVPGYVDAHCHIGMTEDGTMYEGEDRNESTDPITPQMRAIDAINPMDIAFREAVEGGITTVCTGPGSKNVIGGVFAVVKTHGKRIDDMILKETYALKAALGEDPKKTYKERGQSPTTRMAVAALLRKSLLQARSYMQKLALPCEEQTKSIKFDIKMDNLIKVLKKEIPLKVHAHRMDDIYTALRIAREFDINITLDHCTEGYMMMGELKKSGFPIILGPLLVRRSKVEMANMSYKAPAVLEHEGLKFCIASDAPTVPIQFLPVSAGCAVREGLSIETALKAITINAAEILGLENRIGSLKEGKDADMVVYDGEPFNLMSKINMVVIDGEIVYRA